MMLRRGSGGDHFGCIGPSGQSGDGGNAGMLVVLLRDCGVPRIDLAAFAVAFARAANFPQGLPFDGFLIGGCLGQGDRVFLVDFLLANDPAVIRLNLCPEVNILGFAADDVGVVLVPNSCGAYTPPLFRRPVPVAAESRSAPPSSLFLLFLWPS